MRCRRGKEEPVEWQEASDFTVAGAGAADAKRLHRAVVLDIAACDE